MPNYSYFYVRAVADDDGVVKTQKFLKGNPELLDTRQDVWATHGRYKLLTRQMRGGLSGSGDVYNPANLLYKRMKEKFYCILCAKNDGYIDPQHLE